MLFTIHVGLCPGGRVSVQGSLSGGGKSMCGGRSLSAGLCPEGVSVQGSLCTGSLCLGGLCQGVQPPPVNRTTDRCKNITFPQLRLRMVKIYFHISVSN